jgi:Holliday junction resolvase
VALHVKHRGASSELIATLWLLDQGYDVFRNISAHGKVDIVAIRDGEITLIDVKTMGKAKLKNGTIAYMISPRSAAMRAAGIRLLAVNPATGECIWVDGERYYRNDR